MRTRFIITTLLFTIVFTSCKNETKENSNEKKEDLNKELFKVSLDLLMKKNDTIHLYYTEDGSINFTEESSVWLPVEGNQNNQLVTFNLPKDVYPTQLRIDLGVNKENAEIKLSRIKMDYFDKSLDLPDPLFYTYFRINSDITVQDNQTKILKRKNPSQRNGPSFYPHEKTLYQELMKFGKK